MKKLSAIMALWISVLIISLPSMAKFDVHIIYFKPTDAGPIDHGFHTKILKDIQKYMQSEMTRHGFTGKTFPLELNEDGRVVIHTINGKHNSDHYDISDNYDANLSLRVFKEIESELPFEFNNQLNINSRDNVHLIIIGGIEMNGIWRGGPAMGFTWHGGRWGGNAIETMNRSQDFPNHYLAVLAHELGHAFALDPGHNEIAESFNGTVIAWGRTTVEWGDRMRILKDEAVLLDSRPIFRVINLEDNVVPNKNEDLDMGDNEEDKDNGDPISVHPYRKITLTWGEIKGVNK